MVSLYGCVIMMMLRAYVGVWCPLFQGLGRSPLNGFILYATTQTRLFCSTKKPFLRSKQKKRNVRNERS
jgi:hypothetical protein